jgi:MSHA pilin protein MshC
MEKTSSRPVNRPFLLHQSGFSFVELITVVLLIGILSVIAVARFSGNDGIAEFTYQNRLISALRNIQQRAMHDSRADFCFQINLSTGAVAPAFGPPSLDYSAGNQAATCAAGIDASVEFLSTTNTEIAEQGVTLNALDGASSSLASIGFDGMGRPLTNVNNCASGCVVSFVGTSEARVCIESQGYVHAC